MLLQWLKTKDRYKILNGSLLKCANEEYMSAIIVVIIITVYNIHRSMYRNSLQSVQSKLSKLSGHSGYSRGDTCALQKST